MPLLTLVSNYTGIFSPERQGNSLFPTFQWHYGTCLHLTLEDSSDYLSMIIDNQLKERKREITNAVWEPAVLLCYTEGRAPSTGASGRYLFDNSGGRRALHVISQHT